MFQILGGPATYDGQDFYTVRYLVHFRSEQVGRTTVLPDALITASSYEGLQPVAGERLSNVLYADCPECEEPEAIFYEGDYICAWCREMMEQ